MSSVTVSHTCNCPIHTHSLLTASRRVTFDKFGEEGLKAGVPTADGEFVKGYTFHGDARRVFRDFFGGDNPFSGDQLQQPEILGYLFSWNDICDIPDL